MAATLRAVKGQAYLDQALTLAGIILLGRALSTIGYIEASVELTTSALGNAYAAFGVINDEVLSMSLAKDALSLANASQIPAG
jgi:hypothetical protein